MFEFFKNKGDGMITIKKQDLVDCHNAIEEAAKVIMKLKEYVDKSEVVMKEQKLVIDALKEKVDNQLVELQVLRGRHG